MTPAAIVKDLAKYQDAFLDLLRPSNRLGLDKISAERVERLSEISPSSTYPFLMQLLNSLRSGSIDQPGGCSVLEIIESFLVRRAICGHEPTGLHAVFKKLWEDCGSAPTAENVVSAIKAHKTVVWPSTEEVRACVTGRALYGSSITKFVLEQWNRQLGGDQPKITPWIEHILPETMTQSWKQSFSEDEHKKLKDTLANLLPLSAPMNQGLGNESYSTKRQTYLRDSAFKAARKFANDYETWTPVELKTRGTILADWAVERWPY